MDNSELSLRPSTQPLPPARTRPAAPHCNAHFGAQRGLRRLDQGLSVLHVDKDTVADLVQVLDSDAGSLLVAVGDPDGVNATVQQLLSLFQQGASQHCGRDSTPGSGDRWNSKHMRCCPGSTKGPDLS